LTQQLAQGVLGELERDGRATGAAFGLQEIEGAEQFSRVRGKLGGDKLPHVIAAFESHRRDALAHDAEADFFVRRLHAAGHPALQASKKIGAETLQFFQRTVGGEDELLASAGEVIDRVQQLNERGPFAGEELDVVDEQYVGAAALAAEVRQAGAAQRFEELRGELFGREEDRIANAARGGADAFQQMRLADAGGPVKERRRNLAGAVEQ